MTIARHLLKGSLALMMISSFGAYQNAGAVGTPAGTSINNQASVSYSVGGVSQTPITSSVATFVVDNKIDLTVTALDTAPVVAFPNQQAVVATFTVTNTGNFTQSYRLTATDLNGVPVFSNPDTLNGLVLSTAADTNGNGSYDAGIDQIGNLGDVAPAALPTPVKVFVLANIPAGATNGQFASIRLQAQAATAGSTGATLAIAAPGGDTAGVDIVFADAGRDASETADSQYKIQSASLNVTKTVSVISDPLNLTTNPIAIPGAVVEYTISIQNTGAVAATSLSVTDSIPANTAYVAGSLRRDATPLSDAADADGGQAIGSPATSIAVTVPSVAAASTSLVIFRVTVQ
ncbi:MAG: hypothetical protein ACJ8OJ_16635 [Povalibacter sp.]